MFQIVFGEGQKTHVVKVVFRKVSFQNSKTERISIPIEFETKDNSHKRINPNNKLFNILFLDYPSGQTLYMCKITELSLLPIMNDPTDYFKSSNYFLKGSFEMFDRLQSLQKRIGQDLYIASVGYIDTRTSTFSDFQIGITGKCKKDESPKDAAEREVFEEFGIDIDLTNTPDWSDTATSDRRNNVHHYLVRASTCKQYLRSTNAAKNHESRSAKKDDKSNRTCVFIYGTATEILNCMFKSVLSKQHNHDHIHYLAAARLDKCLKVLQQTGTIVDHQKYKRRTIKFDKL